MMTSESLLQRPIIIIGAPRSGTTVTGQILRHHPELCYLEEPRLTWRFKNHRKSDMLRPEDARPEVIAHIRETFAARVAAAGKRRLLEKTPSNALRLPFIDRVFPDAVYIHMIRNGYDSVLSIRDLTRKHATGLPPHRRILSRLRELQTRDLPIYGKEALRRFAPWLPDIGKPLWGPRIPGIDGLTRDLHPLEVSALQWRTCVEHACHFGRQLPDTRYLEMRLEDMSATQMQHILDFAGLDTAPSVNDALRDKFISGKSQQRSLQADPHELDRLAPWITPTMTWLDQSAPEAAIASA